MRTLLVIGVSENFTGDRSVSENLTGDRSESVRTLLVIGVSR